MKTILPIAFLYLLFSIGSCKTDQKEKPHGSQSEVAENINPAEYMRDMGGLHVKRGLVKNSKEAAPGYVLFHPCLGTSTYLMNRDGQIVHEWKGTLNATPSYLLNNGHLVRAERDPHFPVFAAGGQSGIIREYSWEGEIVWNFKYASDQYLTHHDIEILPNGNILAIAYEVKTPEEVRKAGRNPEAIPKAGLWADKIIEIQPTRPEGGRIVWEWHMWDHLVQDYDANLDNYGELSEHPRRFNVNVYEEPHHVSPEEIKERIAGGHMTSNATPENRGSDMAHCNAINYNADLDQIAISTPEYGEIFIIDHSTTTEEAKGSTGGRWGHGGDILYRWGNPQNYGRGGPEDKRLGYQHDIRWIPKGFPGAGNLMLFNNDIPGGKGKFPSVFAAMGAKKTNVISVEDADNYSSVIELVAPVDDKGAYILSASEPFGPKEPVWTYTAPDKYGFYSPFVSSAHRLKNGNTFINSGVSARYFEVNPNKEIVWEYWNPYYFHYRLPDGTFPQPVGDFIHVDFRTTQIPIDHPGLAGKELKPIDPQPEVYVASANEL